MTTVLGTMSDMETGIELVGAEPRSDGQIDITLRLTVDPHRVVDIATGMINMAVGQLRAQSASTPSLANGR